MRSLLLALLAVSLASSPAYAWGPIGHRVTGAIAEEHLTPKARRAVRAILGAETLAEASTWADEMRSSQDPFWQKEASPYHYVRSPKGHGYADEHAPPQGDAMTALAKFAAILKNEASTIEEKQLALRFTVHIVGDLHMPLHAGAESGGGVKVTTFGQPDNLHRAWDETLLNHRLLSYTELVSFYRRKITKERVAEWSTPNPVVWIDESAALQDKIIPAPNANGEIVLGWEYEFAHRDTMDTRLMQGGVRMAAYLNTMFK